MEIKVRLPDGVYCENCPFKIYKQCAYLHGKHLSTGLNGELKATDCLSHSD